MPDPSVPVTRHPEHAGLGASLAGLIARHPALIVVIALLIGALAF